MTTFCYVFDSFRTRYHKFSFSSLLLIQQLHSNQGQVFVNRGSVCFFYRAIYPRLYRGIPYATAW